jgi:hypothetical protein
MDALLGGLLTEDHLTSRSAEGQGISLDAMERECLKHRRSPYRCEPRQVSAKPRLLGGCFVSQICVGLDWTLSLHTTRFTRRHHLCLPVQALPHRLQDDP